MNHIINFAIDINEDDIRERIIKSVEKDTREFIENGLIKKRGYYGNLSIDENLKEILDKHVADVIKENSDKIINLAVDGIVDKIIRSKKFKEKYTEVENEN